MGLIARHIYLDTNVFIAMVERKNEELRAFIDRVSKAGYRLFTSEITLAELLVKPFEEADRELILAYDQLITTGPLMTVLPISRNILRKSAELRAIFGTKLPDSVHVATAVEQQCRLFLSSDRRLKLPENISQVRVEEISSVMTDG
ncbi:MAG: PIN domain-containing protein [Fulvimarina manganoxydans]|uniref:type II toxin-antitoxin system VapC family toxin n=1 Tax=Fulvimarina manganoxydans TaxID=937218 RepID=UPI0023553EE3|nr:PIN domain-containing protein [Fulvimarina manganoxydans]MCK5934676.1 PIN domain-containing protein [Fulvimarina manganoxydans]